jgi:ariadne-1
MDMDNFGDDFKIPPKNNKKSYEVDYDSLSQQAIERLISKDVDHICGIFGVDVSFEFNLR